MRDLETSTSTPEPEVRDDADCDTFWSVFERRLSRRGLLHGGAVAVAALPLGVTGCTGSELLDEHDLIADRPKANGDKDAPKGGHTRPRAPTRLGFAAVAKGLQDHVRVPPGYRAQVLTALGDPIDPHTKAYANDGTQGEFARRIGDHGDALSYFAYPKGSRSSTFGLLVQNHEALTDIYLHEKGPTNSPMLDKTATAARPLAEVIKEQEAHGISVLKIAKSHAGKWSVQRGFSGNARWHVNTPIALAGPACGGKQLITKLSPSADVSYGTLNNCGNGVTPWATYLSGEENFATYFARGDDAAADAARDQRLARYGIPAKNVDPAAKVAPGNYRAWDRAEGGGDLQKRFDCSATGTEARQDFRNEPNHFGYVVELDPYRPHLTAKKRTALGRMAHEGAWFGPVVPGKPVVVYMGDDARNEYVYKFVSDARWDPRDAARGLEAGDTYLDAGKLYAAHFADDGTGTWLLLSKENPALSHFEDLADIVVNVRAAADAVKATKMDRPEWGGVNPKTGEFYVTLTNNSTRGTTGPAVDAANPRSYEDLKGTTAQTGNVNGHIVRLREAGDDVTATAFRWDVYLFGAQADADPARVNLSGLTDDNDFSSPDGIWFDPRGVLWIQTDDGAYTDATNCMLLAALPGEVGDGGEALAGNQKTFLGKRPTSDTLKRFLVGVPGCEITGIDMTPDHTAMFVNVQHPGETGTLTTFQSNWPSRESDDACRVGEAGSRPRTATIVITREDGREIGV